MTPQLDPLVLVVEDDDGVRKMLTYCLERHRYVVAPAASGAEALTVLSGMTPDVIVLDLRMPTMDGNEFLRRITTDCPCAAPVVLVTAYRGDLDRALAWRVNEVVQKPYASDELIAALERVLKRDRPPAHTGHVGANVLSLLASCLSLVVVAWLAFGIVPKVNRMIERQEEIAAGLERQESHEAKMEKARQVQLKQAADIMVLQAINAKLLRD